MSSFIDQPSIFSLAAKRGEWLALRQNAIAGNVANATTPGYVAKDVGAFQAALTNAALDMATTDSMHMSSTPGGARASSRLRSAQGAWDVSPTGNSVSLDQEIAKAGDNAKDFAMTTGVVRSLHRMWLSALKG